jgi:hypothetical protein
LENEPVVAFRGFALLWLLGVLTEEKISDRVPQVRVEELYYWVTSPDLGCSNAILGIVSSFPI